jgi:hypothetical protein
VLPVLETIASCQGVEPGESGEAAETHTITKQLAMQITIKPRLQRQQSQKFQWEKIAEGDGNSTRYSWVLYFLISGRVRAYVETYSDRVCRDPAGRSFVAKMLRKAKAEGRSLQQCDLEQMIRDEMFGSRTPSPGDQA